MYNDVRNPSREAPEPLRAAREFSERLWQRTADYLDVDLPRKAVLHVHQVFCEITWRLRCWALGFRSFREGTGKNLNSVLIC